MKEKKNKKKAIWQKSVHWRYFEISLIISERSPPPPFSLSVCLFMCLLLSLYNYTNGLWIYLIAAARTFIFISTRQCLFVERKSTNFIVDLKFVYVVFVFFLVYFDLCWSERGPRSFSVLFSLFFENGKDSHFCPDISSIVHTIIILYFICRDIYNSLSFYFD